MKILLCKSWVCICYGVRWILEANSFLLSTIEVCLSKSLISLYVDDFHFSSFLWFIWGISYFYFLLWYYLLYCDTFYLKVDDFYFNFFARRSVKKHWWVNKYLDLVNFYDFKWCSLSTHSLANASFLQFILLLLFWIAIKI